MTLQSLWFLLGNVMYSGSQFAIISLLTKFGTTQAVGQYALGLAITAPVFMLSNLQLRTVFVVDTSKRYTFGEYLGLRMATTLVAISITIGIIFLGRYYTETAIVIFLMGLCRIIEAFSDILFGIFQKNERMDHISLSKVAKGLMSILCFSVIFTLTHSLVVSLAAMLLGWLFILVFYDLRTVRKYIKVTIQWQWKTLLPLFKKSLPLGIVVSLMSLNATLPQYFIAHDLGEHALGIFASIAYLMVASNVFISAFGEASTPRLVALYNSENYQGFRTLLGRLILIGIGLSGIGCLAVWVAGKGLLTLIYNKELASYIHLFLWMTFLSAFTFITLFLWYGMTVAQRFKIQIPLFVTVTAVNTGVCWVLIPKWGLMGAVFGILISMIVQTLGSVWVLVYTIASKKTPKGRIRIDIPLQLEGK
ncbi:MAG: hypothetical protein JWM44_4451 [Bacilli bacterium]|nr:hypothetical protein [Bacilli bacterium]